MKNYLYYIYWFYRTLPYRWNFTKFKIQSTTETIQDIIKYNKSISRFGDGEFRLLIKERNIVFQELNEDISNRLLEVLNSNLPNHIVSLPYSFKSIKNQKREAKIHWLNFINIYGDKISKSIDDKNYVFGNAFISRFYIDYVNKKNAIKVVNDLKSIWNNQDVLIVEGEYSRLGVGNDLFSGALSIERIVCPSKDAFRSYDDILEVTKAHGKNKLILIALGPTATILAYDLAKLNFWALDIGHVDVEYMWMMQKAKSKIAIKGRYVAEASSNDSMGIESQYKEFYENSIVHRVKQS